MRCIGCGVSYENHGKEIIEALKHFRAYIKMRVALGKSAFDIPVDRC